MKSTRTLVGALLLGIAFSAQAAVTILDSGYDLYAEGNTTGSGLASLADSGTGWAPGLVGVSASSTFTNQYGGGAGETAHAVVGNTLSGYAWGSAYASVDPGSGSASGYGGAYSYVIFDISEASDASYYSYTLGVGSAFSYNRTSTSYGYDSTVNLYYWDGSTFVLADNNNLDLDHTGAGTIGAGIWAVETYAVAYAGASAFSARSGAYASAYAVAEYSFTAEPVPEPASMAVLGLGLAAVARRRRNK